MAEDIAEALALLLPQGLLFDSPQIYAEVAKLPIVPLEDIRRHWQSYTSMYKKLQDPTACRLENFWWHVWGSDRRKLSGETLARLWQDIASGPTFVPLRGPPQLFRGLSAPHTRSMHESDRSKALGSAEMQGETVTSQPKATPQNLTPSSSRPPPSHPILKKPRGPSSSGPRPTARFVDVPDSEDENAQQSSSSQQSGSGSGSGSGASQSDSSKNRTTGRTTPRSRSPVKGSKKPAPTGKKFVASKVAGKRRPVMPRRQSSQSSTGSVGSDKNSDTSSRDGSSSGRNRNEREVVASFEEDEEDDFLSMPTKAGQSTAKPAASRTSPQLGGRVLAPKRTPSPLSQEQSTGRIKAKTPGPSAKALGKQPASKLGSVHTSPAQLNNSLGISGAAAVATLASVDAASSPNKRREISAKSDSKETSSGQQQPHVAATPAVATAPQMARTKSTESKRLSSGPIPAANFKSPSVVGMSKLAVTGGFDFETPQARPLDDDMPPLGADQPDLQKSSVLDSRFTPTQPSHTPSLPLGRSKSQLTLLLERDKARLGDNHKVGSGKK